MSRPAPATRTTRSARRRAWRRGALVALAGVVLVTGSCDRSTPADSRLCTDECQAGETQCHPAGGLRRCLVPATDDGCRKWSPPELCGDRRACVGGECVCLSPCQPGNRVCASSTAEQLCAGPDADGCYYWDTPTECDPGVDCLGGSCGCLHPYTEGETACSPQGARLTCSGVDASGCALWEETQCAGHQVCTAGTCACENPCVVGETGCDSTGTGIATCEGLDTEGCSYWGEPQPCDVDLVCATDVGFGQVTYCVTATPASCAETNECDFVGQKFCMNEAQYRECYIKPDDGCLHYDCGS